MTDHITLSRKVAEGLQRELSSLMYRQFDGGEHNTCYECSFCSAWTFGPIYGDREMPEIKHTSDCLGEKLMAELDAQLAYR